MEVLRTGFPGGQEEPERAVLRLDKIGVVQLGYALPDNDLEIFGGRKRSARRHVYDVLIVLREPGMTPVPMEGTGGGVRLDHKGV